MRCLALLVLGLAVSQASIASTRSTQARSASPAELRVIITPLAGSPVLRVRYESTHYGSVRLELRDGQGRVLYSELKRSSRFAGDFDLSAYPAGDYTIALRTPGGHYTQLVHLGERSPVVATIVVP